MYFRIVSIKIYVFNNCKLWRWGIGSSWFWRCLKGHIRKKVENHRSNGFFLNFVSHKYIFRVFLNDFRKDHFYFSNPEWENLKLSLFAVRLILYHFDTKGENDRSILLTYSEKILYCVHVFITQFCKWIFSSFFVLRNTSNFIDCCFSAWTFVSA